jgi:hypothetical protein
VPQSPCDADFLGGCHERARLRLRQWGVGGKPAGKGAHEAPVEHHADPQVVFPETRFTQQGGSLLLVFGKQIPDPGRHAALRVGVTAFPGDSVLETLVGEHLDQLRELPRVEIDPPREFDEAAALLLESLPAQPFALDGIVVFPQVFQRLLAHLRFAGVAGGGGRRRRSGDRPPGSACYPRD